MNTSESSTVIVVEDDTQASEAVEALLLSAGYGCRRFNSAEELLAQRLPERRYCLLLDIHLGGMSGLALQCELNKRPIQAPVIIVSANDDPAYRQRALEEGALAFLHKPYDPDILLAYVADAMDMMDRCRARPCE